MSARIQNNTTPVSAYKNEVQSKQIQVKNTPDVTQAATPNLQTSTSLNESYASKTGIDTSAFRRSRLENTLLNNESKTGSKTKTITFTPLELGVFKNRKGQLLKEIKVSEAYFEQKLFNSYGLDQSDPNDKWMLQNAFGNGLEPGENINWTQDGKPVKEFTATLNAAGNYEVSVDLRDETSKTLTQAFTTKLINPNGMPYSFQFIAQMSANAQSGDFQKTAENPELSEIALDMTQMALDVVGIFEPTPFADLTNTGISMVRGNWGDAALTIIGVVPYVGDLAKFGKIPKWLKAIDKISNAIDKFKDVAKYGGKGKEAVEAFVKKAKDLLDKISFDKLPEKIREAFTSLKKKVDDFFSKKKPDLEPPRKPQVAKTATGQKAVSQNTLEHIFHGEINKKGKAVGFHYEGTAAMQATNKTRVTTVTKAADKNGVYAARVEVSGVTKKADSSFFPRTWTKNDVVNAVNEAYIKKIHPDPKNLLYFEGRSSSGVLVGGYLKTDGTIATAFPLHGR